MAKRAIIHCSDSNYGNAALITRWHIDRGFRNIGYSFVINNGQLSSTFFDKDYDGLLETGRPLDEVGAHTRGHNVDTIGIALIGKSGRFTNHQFDSLMWLLNKLDKDFGKMDVFQHSDFDKSKYYCAGLDYDWLQKISSR